MQILALMLNEECTCTLCPRRIKYLHMVHYIKQMAEQALTHKSCLKLRVRHVYTRATVSAYL